MCKSIQIRIIGAAVLSVLLVDLALAQPGHISLRPLAPNVLVPQSRGRAFAPERPSGVASERAGRSASRPFSAGSRTCSDELCDRQDEAPSQSSRSGIKYGLPNGTAVVWCPRNSYPWRGP